MDGHVCVPAVAVQPITAVEWDLADGQTLADAWKKGDARTPFLIYARFKGSLYHNIVSLDRIYGFIGTYRTDGK